MVYAVASSVQIRVHTYTVRAALRTTLLPTKPLKRCVFPEENYRGVRTCIRRYSSLPLSYNDADKHQHWMRLLCITLFISDVRSAVTGNCVQQVLSRSLASLHSFFAVGVRRCKLRNAVCSRTVAQAVSVGEPSKPDLSWLQAACCIRGLKSKIGVGLTKRRRFREQAEPCLKDSLLQLR